MLFCWYRFYCSRAQRSGIHLFGLRLRASRLASGAWRRAWRRRSCPLREIMDLVEMEFPLDPIERLEFGDSSVDVAALDPAYIVRVENEGAVSVVAAMAEGICGDEADSVGPAQDLHNLGSDVESVREVRTNRVQPSSSMVEQQKDPRETLLWTTDMLIQCSTPCM